MREWIREGTLKDIHCESCGSDLVYDTQQDVMIGCTLFSYEEFIVCSVCGKAITLKQTK